MKADYEKYKYVKEKSLLFNVKNDYELSEDEYFLIHAFYLTFTPVSSESDMSLSYIDYGWNSNSYVDNGIKTRITKLFNIDDKKVFVVASKENSLRQIYEMLNLNDNEKDYSFERIGLSNSKGSNHFEKLLILVRNCLAHGAYRLKYCENIKMVIMQDRKDSNVTGRAIIKLTTLLSIVELVDKNNLLSNFGKEEQRAYEF